ncbi:MAG TPA: hypothetical protein VJR47_17100 [Stellaceae bacterium]|nr:hypothetical protein [Stellaceae bacterium]
MSRSTSPAAGAPAARREKRLALRVLELWRQARIDDLAPKLGALKPADAGEDEPYVFMIELYDGAPPRFSFVGDAVRPAGFPSSHDPLVSDCPDESVLHLVTRDWLEIVERGVPVTRGGKGVNNGKPVRYRGTMAPLVDEDGVICAIIGAANWRATET